MTPFEYSRANDAAEAVRLLAGRSSARYLGGGTNLVDLMRETVETPTALIDVTGLSKDITTQNDGGLLIGAAATNTAVASDPAVRERYPLLARAILAGASGQIRNMATVGGNIMQRTRCLYFYDDSARCNKRDRGAGCDALGGFNRYHAILGASEQCIATHPSDMCVALAALDAIIHLVGPDGSRAVPLTEFHRLPGDTPDVETNLIRGELITAIEIPGAVSARISTYRKIRDRSSYAFALVSVAVALKVERDGRIAEVRLALGGVAHRPWRARIAETALQDAIASEASFRAAAEAEMAEARGLPGNTFKIELARRAMVSSLVELVPGSGAF